jgi:hypothetical protein
VGETLIVTGATGAYGTAAVLLGIAMGASRVVGAGRYFGGVRSCETRWRVASFNGDLDGRRADRRGLISRVTGPYTSLRTATGYQDGVELDCVPAKRVFRGQSFVRGRTGKSPNIA